MPHTQFRRALSWPNKPNAKMKMTTTCIFFFSLVNTDLTNDFAIKAVYS